MAAFVSHNKAQEFSLEALRSPEGRSGLLCISQSTWMLAYSLVSFYGYWRSRYYKTDVDGTMLQLDDSEWEEVTDYVDLAIEELSMTGCDEFITVLSDLSTTLAGLKTCCENNAVLNVQLNQSMPHDGVLSFGQPGDQFPDQPTYFDAKCAAANAIYDTIHGFVSRMNDADLDTVVSGALGGITAYLSYLLQGGVLGWAISKVSSFITGIAIKLVGGGEISFTDMASALSEQHSDLVLALYNASDTTTAKSSFLTKLGDATTALNDIETEIIADLLTYDLLNQLFSPRDDIVNYESSDPINCGSGGTVWTFDTGGQGWVFVNESDGTQQASGQWVSAREAWEIHLVITPGNGAYAQGAIYLDGLSIDVDVGNSVQLDYSATSDGLASFQQMIVTYSDQSQDVASTSGSSSSAGTLILDITEAKTIEEIRVSAKRETGSYDYTIDFEEVRVQ